MNGGALAVVPARLASTRLPRKPLHPLAGRPLIEWVWRRVVSFDLFATVVVATDSGEVAAVARGFGARVEMTAPEHPSGTDRVAEVAARPEYAAHDVVVNVQGDEPFVRREHLAAAMEMVERGGWEIGTAASAITTADELANPAVVKVVTAEDGGALLFSRAPIPFKRDAAPTSDDFAGGAFLRHVGIYVYHPDALQRWVALPEGRLEHLERLEQLRPLAAGLRIGVARVSDVQGGVDTPADAVLAESRLRAENLF